jgi:capsular exopolysaccharide synthesis family protein
MSKFFKALEQAKRDRALGGPPDATRAGEVRLFPPEATEPTRAPQRVTEPPDDVDEHLVSLVTPAAFEAEQYRALRHVVEQMHRAADLKIVAVSSPGMGDGKTITAINLAGALAQSSEARVLLVDADLRRPALARLLGLGDADGVNLVDGILGPGIPLSRIAQPRPPFNLSVICAGQSPPSPYEVLKSPQLGELLAEARRQYDYIILDTPPLHPVQDCRVIGRWVDGFLLVVTAHRTPRRLVEEALTTLDPGKVLGLVFNGADHPISGYYSGYYYRDDYSADRSSSNDPAGGVLKRTARRVGESLWRHRKPSASTRGPWHGGPR